MDEVDLELQNIDLDVGGDRDEASTHDSVVLIVGSCLGRRQQEAHYKCICKLQEHYFHLQIIIL